MIKISDFGEIIISQLNLTINQIFFIVILGFIMLSTFNFVCYLKILENGVTTIFSSFIIGYLYKLLAKIIPVNISEEIDNCLIIITGILISYIFARLTASGKFNRLLSKLNIHRTSNKIIWTDLIDNEYAMKVSIEMPDNKKYIGFLGITEEFNQKPVMSLYGYKIINSETNNVIEDNTSSYNKVIVLDSDKALNIEIIYNKNSSVFKDTKNFLSRINSDDNF